MKTYAERKQRTPHTLVGHVGNSKQASLCEILQSSHDKLLERKAIQCQINNNSPGTKIKDELKIPSVNNFVPIQRYATFTEGGKIYNISNSGQAICGLEYPNHELYVLDFNTIMQKEGAMIEFVPKEKRQFTRLNSTYRTKEYIRVEPKWKKEHDFSSKKLISSFSNLNDVTGGYNEEFNSLYQEVNEIRKSSENLRKFFVQLQFKWPAEQSQFTSVYEMYKEIHIKLSSWLYPERGKKPVTGSYDTLIENLTTLKSDLEVALSPSSYIPTVFDNNSERDDVHEMYGPIVNNIDSLISKLRQIKSRISIDTLGLCTREAFLYEQTYSEEVKMPRGCDMVASLFGRYESQSKSSMLNFTVKDSTAHHYATIISQDNSDYITIEGFAKKNYAGVDDTWEFFMHGHFNTSPEQAFTDYTKIRYTYFDQFKGGIDPTRPHTSKETGNCYSDTINSFMGNYYKKNE